MSSEITTMAIRREQEEDRELRKACRLVENHCRSLGKDCQVIFMARGVSIAPPAWAGDSTGGNLFEALQDALEHQE